MKTMSLEQALAVARTLAPVARAATVTALSKAVAHGMADGEISGIFDPLECTPARAAQCGRGPEIVPDGHEVCAVFVDDHCTCPSDPAAAVRVGETLPLFPD